MGAKVYSAKGKKEFPTEYIINELTKYDVATLVDHVEKEHVDGKVTFLCFEKFYFRTSSSAALTIMASESNGVTDVEVVSLAGGEGLFNISWGANKDFAQKIIEALQRVGFEIVEKF